MHAKSPADPATTRVAIQSVEAAREHISKLPNGSTLAILTVINDVNCYWLGKKQSGIQISDSNDATTDIYKGEEIVRIIWYEEISHLKYMKLDYETQVSVSSVLVTVSNIVWTRVTTNRYYLGETTHEKLSDIVQNMSHL